MNVNDFFRTIPEHLHGNIAVSATKLTITDKTGKGVAYDLGAEIDSLPVKDAPANTPVVKAKEVKSVNMAVLSTKLGIEVAEKL